MVESYFQNTVYEYFSIIFLYYYCDSLIIILCRLEIWGLFHYNLKIPSPTNFSIFLDIFTALISKYTNKVWQFLLRRRRHTYTNTETVKTYPMSHYFLQRRSRNGNICFFFFSQCLGERRYLHFYASFPFLRTKLHCCFKLRWTRKVFIT